MRWNTQRGMTLIELLAALTITGMVLGLVATATLQFFRVGNEGTLKLVVLDEMQITARLFTQDAQDAYRATGTPSGKWLALNYCLHEGGFNYCTPQGTAIFGVITCCGTGTITYSMCDSDGDGNVNDLCRTDDCCRQNPNPCFIDGTAIEYCNEDAIKSGTGTMTVMRDVIADFSVEVHSGTSGNRYTAYMHLAAPAHDPVADKAYAAYLRASDEIEP